MSEPGKREIPVWDMPTRLFHWSLTALFVVAWVTSGGGSLVFALHEIAGYGMIALVLWRLFWGVMGNSYSRFSGFLKPVHVVRDYLSSLLELSPPRSIGHNPLGGYMIILLLVAAALTSGSGLFASDDGLAGPLADTMSSGASRVMSVLHSALTSVIMGLVILHVAGVALDSYLTQDNLVRAMITGRKAVSGDEVQGDAAARAAPAWRAALALVVSLALTWLLISG